MRLIQADRTGLCPPVYVTSGNSNKTVDGKLEWLYLLGLLGLSWYLEVRGRIMLVICYEIWDCRTGALTTQVH